MKIQAGHIKEKLPQLFDLELTIGCVTVARFAGIKYKCHQYIDYRYIDIL
jgi:hypothetical protein